MLIPLIRSGSEKTENGYDYKYDNNKSPFYYCKTPKWYFIVHIGLGGYVQGNQNNVTEISTGGGRKYEYKYEYASNGFPPKCTVLSDVIFGCESVTTFQI